MMDTPLFRATLVLVPERLAICRLPADADLPDEISDATFWSMTRTSDELSVILPQDSAPTAWDKSLGWRGLKVAGPLAFELTGVISALSQPLAEADIPIFSLSTYDTDYILVPQDVLAQACAVLSAHGHTVLYNQE